jgi:multidrug efflux pump subunit AcrB
MNLAEWSIKKKVVVVFACAIMTVGGILAYFQMGKLEDPEFTIKNALVVTRYPGAGPKQVEEEVTDVIEVAVQQLSDLDHVRSISRAGLSIVYVDIKESCKARRLPQVWDELRRKVNDAQSMLPPGAGPSMVKDDFGDVYGVLLAVTGDGYSYRELKDYVDDLRRELLMVRDVARVEIWGEQVECVYVDISRSKLAELGIPPTIVLGTLHQQNLVVDAGSANADRERMRMAVSGEFDSVEAIGDLVVRGYPSDKMIYLKDIATIGRGYLEPTFKMMRFDGKPALALAVSTVSGGNVITMGEGVKERLNQLMAEVPVGVEINTVAFQSDIVQESVNDFMINLIEAIIIVIVVLLIAMGLQSGVLIGVGLLLTILASFMVMKAVDIDLHRISLGALIIALGMLVDNAIVVTEGILVKLQRGMDRLEAASKTVSETAWPLLGATLVAVLAFLPVYIAKNNTGEFCKSLFEVVGISLLVSWILAMTATPLLCHMYMNISKEKQGRDPYEGRIYQSYKRLLIRALHHRVLTMTVITGLLVLAVIGFGFVDQMFFPKSKRPQLMIDYWLTEGARIESVSADLKKVEDFLRKDERVVNVSSFIGEGPPRFYLPLEPEINYASYGQLIVNVTDPKCLDSLLAEVEKYLKENFPYSEPLVRKFPMGPVKKFKIEARFRGPDDRVLHELSEQAKAIMAVDGMAKDIRDNWRQPVKKIVPDFSQPRARQAAVSREDVAMTLKRSYDGLPVGIYREKNNLLPIIVRPTEDERKRLEDLETLQVWDRNGTHRVPLGQVVSGVKTEWEEPIVRRRDRQRCITAQCEPRDDNAPDLLKRIRPKIEAMTLSPGYSLEWGGEYEDSSESQKYIFAGVPLTAMFMAVIIVALFNGFRQPIIIGLVLPLSLIGITAGLLLTHQPFGFMALLGALSLAGMLIKNAVVLIDQIDVEIREGKDRYLAVIDSAVSRIRPVMMASLTTLLGMTPLLMDEFWRAMAVAIIFGLSFGTILTLIVVPVLYTLFFRIPTRLRD